MREYKARSPSSADSRRPDLASARFRAIIWSFLLAILNLAREISLSRGENRRSRQRRLFPRDDTKKRAPILSSSLDSSPGETFPTVCSLRAVVEEDRERNKGREERWRSGRRCSPRFPPVSLAHILYARLAFLCLS